MTRRRRYLGPLLASMRYLSGASFSDGHDLYYVWLHDEGRAVKFEGATWQDVIRQIKDVGYQVWGQHPLDYYCPQNALEKWMVDQLELKDGDNEDDHFVRNPPTGMAGH